MGFAGLIHVSHIASSHSGACAHGVEQKGIEWNGAIERQVAECVCVRERESTTWTVLENERADISESEMRGLSEEQRLINSS